jgi:hypothetical protein
LFQKPLLLIIKIHVCMVPTKMNKVIQLKFK